MYGATNGTLDSNGNQSFVYEIVYSIHNTATNSSIMNQGRHVLIDATNDVNSSSDMLDGTETGRYDIESLHNVSNEVDSSNLPLAPGTYKVGYQFVAFDANNLDGGCQVVADLSTTFTVGTSVVPCNIAWSNTNFQTDWNTDIFYNSASNELEFDIDMYTASNGTLDSNGNQNFNYTIGYQLLDSNNNVLTPNNPVLSLATSSVNNNLNMTRGISGNSNFAPADFVAGDQRDITQDVTSNTTLPLSPGTYSVNIFIIAEDLNHPGSCTINTTLTNTFTVAAPVVNQLLPGVLTLTQARFGEQSADVNAVFTSASGGTAPYTYTNIQWRETDANGNVLSGMTGTFRPINSSPSPSVNNPFQYTWPFGSQIAAYINVTYEITDSSNPPQMLTHEGDIVVTRPGD